MSLKTQNDIAWEALFTKYEIIRRVESEGKFVISAAQIKTYREPRLMAKFDHHINLPQIFIDNKLAILPISRGDYVIAPLEAYQPFETLTKTITHMSLPPHIQSLDSHNINSEAVAINCALAAGILNDFLGEERLIATVSGRMGSGQFMFQIRNCLGGDSQTLSVNNSQIEIDAALEGMNSMALVEAKRDLAADFIIRQLYYPFRLWQSRLAKPVRPIFLVYSNGIYSLYEYAFQDRNSYNSLVLVNHKNYAIEDTALTLHDLLEIKQQVTLFDAEPQISFPQADKFGRVINLCELLAAGSLTREEVTEQYAFDLRQTNYYTDAARYLGLITKQYSGRIPLYCLSALGESIMQLNYKQRQLALCKCILAHKVFNDVFTQYVTGRGLDKQTIIHIMKQSKLHNISSDSTYHRRASTISSWLNWMLELVA